MVILVTFSLWLSSWHFRCGYPRGIFAVVSWWLAFSLWYPGGYHGGISAMVALVTSLIHGGNVLLVTGAIVFFGFYTGSGLDKKNDSVI